MDTDWSSNRVVRLFSPFDVIKNPGTERKRNLPDACIYGKIIMNNLICRGHKFHVHTSQIANYCGEIFVSKRLDHVSHPTSLSDLNTYCIDSSNGHSLSFPNKPESHLFSSPAKQALHSPLPPAKQVSVNEILHKSLLMAKHIFIHTTDKESTPM